MKVNSKRVQNALAVVGFFCLLVAGSNRVVASDSKIVKLPVEEPVKIEKTVQSPEKQMRDLSGCYEVILTGATKEFLAGYPVDDSFLMWFTSNYGEDTILQIAYAVLDKEQHTNTWYEHTGNSMHVLWYQYQQEFGFGNQKSEQVIFTECKNDNTVISFAGDFNLAEDWYTMEHYNKGEHGLSDCIDSALLAMMQDSDILMMNNEFVYSDCKEALQGKAYTFRADLERISILEEFGADIVSLGNNHTYDFGEEGLLDTIEILEKANIAYVGAGRNLDEAKKIVYFVANGRKIALVSATEIERSKKYTKEATEDTAGVLKTLNPTRFCKVIEEADRYSDYVIVLPHWGAEGSIYPDDTQRKLAKQFVESGADIIIGGHPHRLQGIGYIDEIPVVYSIGNFWFSTGTLYTTLAQVIINAKGELGLRIQPCVQKDLTTSLITDKTEKDEFYRYITAISSSLGVDEEGNVYHKLGKGKEFLYDSYDSRTKIRGSADNEGYPIDIVGNRIE